MWESKKCSNFVAEFNFIGYMDIISKKFPSDEFAKFRLLFYRLSQECEGSEPNRKQGDEIEYCIPKLASYEVNDVGHEEFSELMMDYCTVGKYYSRKSTWMQRDYKAWFKLQDIKIGYNGDEYILTDVYCGDIYSNDDEWDDENDCSIDYVDWQLTFKKI